MSLPALTTDGVAFVINALFETAVFDLKTVVHSQRLKYAAQLRSKPVVFNALDLS